ncbi:hypothetical protein [Streptomyces chartreusis]
MHSSLQRLASRRLAGWAIADHMRSALVVDALAAAERCSSLTPLTVDAR